MSESTIPAILVTQFSDFLHMKSQQIQSRLRPHVTVAQLTADNFAYDGLGAVEAREVNGRIVPVVFDNIEHLRRKIKRRRFVVTLPIDASDVRGMLADQNGAYATASISAMERIFDRVGVEASFATVQTGRDFSVDLTFAQDGGLTVDATAGLIYESFLEANKNFTNNDVGTDMPENRILLTTGDEEEQLMLETDLTSGDFSRQFVIDAGTITRAVGNQLVYYGASAANPILNVTGAVRDNVLLTGRGLYYGMSKSMNVTVKDRSDFVETTQVQIVGELGAVRTEGALIQKVTTTPS